MRSSSTTSRARRSASRARRTRSVIVERSGEHPVPLPPRNRSRMRSSIGSSDQVGAWDHPSADPATRATPGRPCPPFYTGCMAQFRSNRGKRVLYTALSTRHGAARGGRFEEAPVPLKEAARQAPEKAPFVRRWPCPVPHAPLREAATEFEAVVETPSGQRLRATSAGRALTRPARPGALAIIWRWRRTCGPSAGTTGIYREDGDLARSGLKSLSASSKIAGAVDLSPPTGIGSASGVVARTTRRHRGSRSGLGTQGARRLRSR